RAHSALLRLRSARALPHHPRHHGCSVGIQEPHAGDDLRPRTRTRGTPMKSLSRRTLITTGIAAAAGVSGLAVADRMARRYGLIPPDCHGIYGPGETLTYAAQRLLTTHSLAREFPRSMISTAPFANPTAPPNDAF